MNSRWGKVRALAGLAVIGFVGTVGQYTIQNSRFPDWLASLFVWAGTTGDSVISAFIDTTIPLWLVTLLGLVLAAAVWISLYQYFLEHEKLTTANKELFQNCKILEEKVATLKFESIQARDSLSKAQNDFLEARIARNTALEQAGNAEIENAKLIKLHEALKIKHESLEIRLAAVQNQFDSSQMNKVDSTDISLAAVNMVQSFIKNQAATGQATTITHIAKSLSYTPSTVRNAINNLTNLGLIRSGITWKGEKTFLPK